MCSLNGTCLTSFGDTWRCKLNTVAQERDKSRRTEEITGVFERISWQNEDGTFFFGVLRDGRKVAGNGRSEVFIRGVEYTFGGKWEESKYGQQFRFFSYTQAIPITPDAIISYLEKHLASKGCGIGAVRIRKMIAKWGPERVIPMVKENPVEVSEFCGIELEKAKKASELLKSIEKFESTRIQLGQLFDGRGFPQATIEKCIDIFGVNAVDCIKRNPFTLLVRGLPGCGFIRVNQLYESLGHVGKPREKRKREVIYLWHTMKEGNGSIWFDARQMVQNLARIITTRTDPKRSIQIGIRAKWLASRRDQNNTLWIAVYEESVTERLISQKLAAMLTGTEVEEKKEAADDWPPFTE